MHTRYFKIETKNGPITGSRIMDALVSTYMGAIKENDKVTEVESPSEPEQPSVPIQFVWAYGSLHHADALKDGGIVLKGDSCEQIGAVLYVRRKE